MVSQAKHGGNDRKYLFNMVGNFPHLKKIALRYLTKVENHLRGKMLRFAF